MQINPTPELAAAHTTHHGMEAIDMNYRRAFTVIELLVVVAIISLLLGLLVPSLVSSQNSAYNAGCQAHLRGACRAVLSYSSDSFGFIPGPNTSGSYITSGYTAFRNDSSEPTYNMDWVSPLLGRERGLPGDRLSRIGAIFNDAFRCPANAERFTMDFGGSGLPPSGLSFTSYCSPLGFYVSQSPVLAAPLTSADPTLGAIVPVTSGAMSHLNRFGGASGKIFAMDGARYVYNDATNVRVSFNEFTWQNDGGNFMDYGPVYADAKPNGSPYKKNPDGTLANANRFAYRHFERMNATFFDNHCESLTYNASLRTELYFPAGAVVQNAANSLDPNDSDGMIVK